MYSDASVFFVLSWEIKELLILFRRPGPVSGKQQTKEGDRKILTNHQKLGAAMVVLWMLLRSLLQFPGAHLKE